jgi:hypothetical protein
MATSLIERFRARDPGLLYTEFGSLNLDMFKTAGCKEVSGSISGFTKQAPFLTVAIISLTLQAQLLFV